MANLEKITELNKRSKAFIANISIEIDGIAKELEPKIVNLNKMQFDDHINSKGEPLVHNVTGSSLLSTDYAKRTNKTRPDMNLTGSFRGSMFSIYDERNYTFSVSSTDDKIRTLPELYNDLLGLVPENLQEVQQLAGLRLQKSYIKELNG